ncbi:MAG: DUF3458 domain-containing protein, partial [Geminicoccaceae bacterium]
KRIGDVALLREGQFTEDAGPLAHPIRPATYVEINNFYTRTVYEKGAEVIRMIETLIGKAAFAKGLQLYFDRHDGEAVTCEDFVAAMATASGRDFGQFFRWYHQAGTPRVTVESHHDAATERYTLTLRQSTPPTPGQPSQEPFVIPLRLGLIGPDGRALPLQLQGENAPGGSERVLEFTEAERTFTFENVPARPVPSLFRGFSAPVRIEAALTDDDLAHLLAFDTDGFAKWDAGQSLALRELLRLIESGRQGAVATLSPRLVEALAAVLDDAGLEPAFKAQLVGLPSATYLGEQMAVIDVEAIGAARERAQAALGAALAERWHQLVASHDDADFQLTSEAMGRRRLKNTSLAYLAHGAPDTVRARIVDQALHATNMTDQLAALAMVARRDWPERQEVLDAFYAQWQHEPLVVNKWFSVQAMAERDAVVEEVEALLRHPAFTVSNPNRVRAVVGVFAAANPLGFHRQDGRGYRLVADMVATLDRKNPQIAARLATTFNRWRRYDPHRQRRMCAELERLAATEGLSRDLYEIVEKSLQANPNPPG